MMIAVLNQQVLKRPILWIAFSVSACAILASGLAKLNIRTDGEAIYPENNLVVSNTIADRETFDDPEQVILLITTSENGPLVSSREGLEFIKMAHEEIAAIEGVSSAHILSIASLTELTDDGHTIRIGEYLDLIPADSSGAHDLVLRLRKHPLTSGLLLSTDGTCAVIYAPMKKGENRLSFIEKMRSFIKGNTSKDFEIYLTGPLIAEATLGEMVLRDLLWLVPIMVSLIAILLLLTLRTPGGVMIPLLVALLTLLSALGLMGHLGIPVTLVTTILPIILMAISITDSIHILERVQDELSAVKDKNTVAQVSSVSMKEVSANAIKQIAWPIVATSVTTALALLSFLSAGMAPMRHFGIFTSIGILIAMILSLTLVPALISIMPVKFFSRFGKSGKIRKSSSTALIARNPLVSFWGGVVFLALVAPGLLYLTVQDSWIDNFSANSRLAKAERIYNTNFWGSYRFDITVTEESGDFLTPSGVSTMKTLIRITSDAPFARGVVTFLTPLEAIKTSMGHKGSIESYSEELLAELTTVADLSQDRSGLTQLLTQDAAIARARIFVNTPNYQRGDSLRKFLAVKLSEDANLALNKFHFSGDIPVAVEIVESIVTNQMRSIGWTVLGVLVILFLVFRSVRLSLIGIIPSVLAMVIVFGLMGYFGMAVGIATSAFASLTIGVGVDFALHFIYRYRNEAEKLKGANTMSMSQETKKIALRETARKTGVAIRWNAIVLSLGFLSLSLSEIGPNRVLGILLAGAMVACYLATFAFLPRLLTRFLAIVIVCGLVSTAPVNAQDSLVQFENANFKNDRRAEKIFAKIEKRFRTTPRAIKMDIKTTYPNNRFLNRIMWGVTNNSEKRSWLLYVVTEPKRLGGTALLLNDNDADGPPDSSWLYLPGFKHFRHISGRAHKTLVPGTTLSYEDSRGYISTEKYFFRFQEIPNSRKDTAYIIAWPKTDSISQDLGYSKLEIAVDRRKFLVARVRFIGLRGQTVKFYRVLNTTKLAGMWLPSEVTLKIHASEMVTLARYSYWKLSHEPAESIFTPSIDSVKFLPRLLDVLERNGIDIEN